MLVINKQKNHSLERNNLTIDNVYKILVEGNSKKSNKFLKGRTSENKIVVFPKSRDLVGKYVDVKINECNSATLFGEICYFSTPHRSSITQRYRRKFKCTWYSRL